MPHEEESAALFTVHGRVQGVGFRHAAWQEGRRLGLKGWVRNLPGGEVQCFAQGRAEVLDLLAAWLGHGPPSARVTHLDRAPADQDATLTGFDVRR